jgi:hypothetical protein
VVAIEIGLDRNIRYVRVMVHDHDRSIMFVFTSQEESYVTVLLFYIYDIDFNKRGNMAVERVALQRRISTFHSSCGSTSDY